MLCFFIADTEQLSVWMYEKHNMSLTNHQELNKTCLESFLDVTYSLVYEKMSKDVKHGDVVWSEASIHQETGFNLTHHSGVTIQETQNTQLCEKTEDLQPFSSWSR